MGEVDRRWLQGQADLAARTGSVQAIAHTADHHLNLEAPKLVALAVRAVVQSVRDGTGNPPWLDPEELAEAGGYRAAAAPGHQ